MICASDESSLSATVWTRLIKVSIPKLHSPSFKISINLDMWVPLTFSGSLTVIVKFATVECDSLSLFTNFIGCKISLIPT